MQNRPPNWAEVFDDLNHSGQLVAEIAGEEYGSGSIASAVVTHYLFDKTVSVGNACAASLTLKIIPKGTIPRMAKIVLKYALTAGKVCTEAIPNGTFYINKRKASGRYVTLECYDAMLMAEQDYLGAATADAWPKSQSAAVQEIATRIGVALDPRTVLREGSAYMVNLPTGQTMREVLQHIAAAQGGNWTITEEGALYLVPLCGTGDTAPAVTGVPDLSDAQTVTGIRLWLDENTYLDAGAASGKVLEADCPDATQKTADDLLARLKGFAYCAYNCGRRHVDPAMELGDVLPIGSHRCVVYSAASTLGTAYYADVSAPQEEAEVEDEYPYLSQIERVQKRIAHKVDENAVRSAFAMDASNIKISSGKVAFEANTLAIESDNFKLSENGTVSAKGSFETSESDTGWKATFSQGGLSLSTKGENRASLFQAGNYDAAYLALNGHYADYNAEAWFASDGISISKNGVSVFNVSPNGLTLSENTDGVLSMGRSKFHPHPDTNALFPDWRLVNGADGNTYWALCGFTEYQGS